MLKWFDAKVEMEFGTKLADLFDQRFRQIESGAEHKHDDKRKKLISQILLEVKQFGESHKLNVYKKAKLGNAFKWRLKDLGHDDALIDQLTKDLLVILR